MNLAAYEPETMGEDFLLFFTKETDAPLQKNQTKAQETVGNELMKSRRSFSFDIPLQLEKIERMLGLTG